MKHLIIIEGPDNTGKDTLEKNLQDKLGNCISYHFSSPPSTIPKYDKLNYQIKGWQNTWLNTQQSMEVRNLKFGIWNRSHLGEYVYGPMYRNMPENVVIEEIKKFESTFLEPNKNEIKPHLVVLIPNIQTVIQNDDGLSHSIDIIDKTNEIYKFKQFVNITSIEDCIIYEVCEPNGNFKDPLLICEQILNRLDI